MEKTWTAPELREQLKAFSHLQGKIVHIHSSLRAVGRVEGRGEALLELLIEFFTQKDGLLTIPTHTWDGSGVDLRDNVTCVGTLSRLAAAHPKATRSAHPSHSMAVFGRQERVDGFIKGDATATAPAPADGCYGKLYDEDGYVLLVGVGHNRDTFLHSVEERLNVPNRLSREPVEKTVIHRDGRVEKRMIHTHVAEGIGDVSANYPKLEPAFRAHGCITDARLGSAPVQICSARGMQEVFTSIYQKAQGQELFADLSPLDPGLY